MPDGGSAGQAVVPAGPIFDVDTHLADASEQLWRPYFTARDSEYLPRVVDHEGTQRVLAGGMLLPKPSGHGIGSPLGIHAGTDGMAVDERARFMRDTATEHALLLPGFVGLAAHNAPDSAARHALAAAHNRLIKDITDQATQLLYAPVVLPDDPEWSISELTHLAATSDVRAAVCRPTTRDARPFRSGTENQLLGHLAAENIPLLLHAATGYHQASPVADLFDDYRMTHLFSHPVEQMIALADLVQSGALRAGLRVAIIEAGCGWLPWFARQLAEHLRHAGGCESSTEDIIGLIRDRVIVSVEPDDPGVGTVSDLLGESFLCFGSDYPHWDAVSPESMARMQARLGEQLSKRIFYANAHAFFLGG